METIKRNKMTKLDIIHDILLDCQIKHHIPIDDEVIDWCDEITEQQKALLEENDQLQKKISQILDFVTAIYLASTFTGGIEKK